MGIGAMRSLDKKIFLEIFYKKIKMQLGFLIAFNFFYKCGIKIFFKWSINKSTNLLKEFINQTHNKMWNKRYRGTYLFDLIFVPLEELSYFQVTFEVFLFFV